MKERLICGLDLGTSKLAITSAKIDRAGRLNIIGIDTLKLGTPDLKPSLDYIQKILALLKNRIDLRFPEFIINVSGNFIFPRYSRAAIPLSDRGTKLINRRIVERLNLQARNLGLGLEERLLHEFPQAYTIDTQTRSNNPVGMYGRRLEVETFLISAQLKKIQDIIYSLSQAGCEVKNFVFSGLASGLGVLGQIDRNKGCVLIDIGAGLTEIAIFKDGILRQIQVINFGGNDLTESIAKDLKVPFNLAEEIKLEYAVALSKERDEDEEIIIKKNSGYDSVKRSLVTDAIIPRLNRINKLIKKTIAESNWRQDLSAGVIITGGFSLLDGFIEMLELELGMPVKMGLPRQVTSSQYKSPLFATSIGLVNYAYEAHLNKVSGLNKAKSWIDQLISPLKFVYQEYF